MSISAVRRGCPGLGLRGILTAAAAAGLPAPVQSACAAGGHSGIYPLTREWNSAPAPGPDPRARRLLDDGTPLVAVTARRR